MLPIFKEKKESNQEQIAHLNQPQKKDFSFHNVGNKVNFISLGCPRNLVDSEVMLGILLKAGYEVTADVYQADYIIINTCSFLEASRQESKDTIAQTIEDKKKGAKLIVAGCMAQSHLDELQTEYPQIDYFLGSGDVEKILDAVESKESKNFVTNARSFLEMGEIPRTLSTPKHFAYLKIAEGCRKKCSYCIIPNIKGPLKSKSEEQILKEFNILLDRGVKEVVLIAQDLGDYGKDFAAKGSVRSSKGLENLLKSLIGVKRDFWLRLLYLYPDEITDDLISIIKSDSRICPYLDMPIQHINDKMLKSMRRATSKQQIIDIIEKLRAQIPNIFIRTSLIVGFPGETEEQFAELADFIQKHPLDNVGIFKYSREKGSHSYDLENQVPEEIKQLRYQKLMKLQQKVLKKRQKRLIGQRLKVVVEGYHPESKMLMIGRHMGQCPDIDGQVIINDGRKVKAFGEVYTVEISEQMGYDLLGQVIG